MAATAPFNIDMVFRANVNNARGGMKDVQSDLSAVAGEAERAGAAIRQQASSIDEMSVAGAKSAKWQLEDARSQLTRNYVQVQEIGLGYTSNLAANFNDIGVMMAAGQSPIQLALQQGTQVSQVLTDIAKRGGGTAGALRGIAAGFTSIISPISLATIGIIGLGTAGVQWLTSLRGETKTFGEALEELSGAVGSYEKSAALARSSTDELKEQFGGAADEVRDLIEAIAELDRRTAMRRATDTLDQLKQDRGLWLPELDWRNDNPNATNESQLFDTRRGIDRRRLRGLFDLDRSAESTTLLDNVLDAMSRADAAEGTKAQIEALKYLEATWVAAAKAANGMTAE